MSPEIAWAAFWGISLALILVSCVQPNSVAAFLADEKIQVIVTGGGGQPQPPPPDPGGSGGIKYEHPPNNPPKVTDGNGKGSVNNPITLSIVASLVTLTVSNYNDYTGGIVVYYNGAVYLSSLSGSSFDVNVSLFSNTKGMYQLSVTGIQDGKAYNTDIYIIVVD